MPDYFLAVNADTSSTSDWVCKAIQRISENVHSGMCQPKILLYDQKTKLNSNGNEANFLFFGWPGGCGETDDHAGGSRLIAFPSGCAFVCARECILALKGFDDSYFMYGEDVDFGLRAFIAGWDTVYSPSGAVYHKYKFRESPSKYFLLERNRLTTLLKVYRCRTLSVILPALVLAEFGVILKACREGWLREKITSYASVLRRIPDIMNKRAEVQRLRLRSDSDLIRLLKGGIQFPSVHRSRSTLLGNVFLDKYHKFLTTLRL
jgi:GT2 family glycosyltransferase